MLEQENLTPQQGRVELNIGIHSFNDTSLLTLPTERRDIENRFNSLYLRLKNHLESGENARVVFITEAADLTYEEAQKIESLCDLGMSPGSALVNAVRFPWSEPIEREVEYPDSFQGIELKIADTLASQFPGQFFYRVERGSHEETIDMHSAIGDLVTAIESIRYGWGISGWGGEAYKKALINFYNLQPQRNRRFADQVNTALDTYKDSNLLVVVVAGTNHGSDISHELLMRGIISSTVDDGNPPSMENLLRKGDDATELEWTQAAIIAAWQTTPLYGKTHEEAMGAIKEIVQKYLCTQEAILQFQQRVQEVGWIKAIQDYYISWIVER